MAYASEQDARDAYAGTNAPAAKLTAVVTAAAGMVRRVAPPPDPEPSDYSPLAKSAELLAGDYLWRTGGYRQSATVYDATDRYGGFSDVERAIRDIMGVYASDAARKAAEGSYTLDVASTFPAPDATLPSA